MYADVLAEGEEGSHTYLYNLLWLRSFISIRLVFRVVRLELLHSNVVILSSDGDRLLRLSSILLTAECQNPRILHVPLPGQLHCWPVVLLQKSFRARLPSQSYVHRIARLRVRCP